MPDVWTTNPKKLKNYLLESGSVCEVEPRVLEGRDPEWTCTYDSKGWLRDVYIHPVQELFVIPLVYNSVIIAAGAGLIVGLLWGKRFWSEDSKSKSP